MGVPPLAGARTWSTSTTAVADREEAVREALGDTHLPWELRLPDPVTYGCELGWGSIGETSLVECRSEPVAGHRAQTQIRRTEADTVAVLLVLAGRERVRQNNVTVELVAGDALLWNSNAPVDFEVMEAVHKLTLLVPTDRVAASHPGRQLATTSLPGHHPAVRLLTGHMRTLAGVGPDLSVLDGVFAVDVTLDLLVKALEPAHAATTAATPAARSLLERALLIIANELADPNLGPSALARRLGISPRYLHMLFTDTGQTVAAYIRRRRIERVRHDLADPVFDDDTVTTIAFRWGFSDSGHLSRSFRAEYGISPTQFRRAVRSRRS